MKLTYQFALGAHNICDEAGNVVASATTEAMARFFADAPQMVPALKSLCFIAETVAHTSQREREILPVTDAMRTLLDAHSFVLAAPDSPHAIKPIEVFRDEGTKKYTVTFGEDGKATQIKSEIVGATSSMSKRVVWHTGQPMTPIAVGVLEEAQALLGAPVVKESDSSAPSCAP